MNDELSTSLWLLSPLEPSVVKKLPSESALSPLRLPSSRFLPLNDVLLAMWSMLAETCLN